MTDKDLDQIRTVIKYELKPIEDTLEKHGKKLDGITNQLADVSEDVSEIKEKVTSHEKRISKIEDQLSIATPNE